MPQTPGDSDISAVIEEIRQHLKRYPQAADTLEGISRWWLSPPRLRQAQETVRRALDHLIAEGVVTQYVTAEGKTVYSGVKTDSEQHS